jgi:hypothetical protein
VLNLNLPRENDWLQTRVTLLLKLQKQLLKLKDWLQLQPPRPLELRLLSLFRLPTRKHRACDLKSSKMISKSKLKRSKTPSDLIIALLRKQTDAAAIAAEKDIVALRKEKLESESTAAKETRRRKEGIFRTALKAFNFSRVCYIISRHVQGRV